jgi:signal peptidase I
MNFNRLKQVNDNDIQKTFKPNRMDIISSFLSYFTIVFIIISIAYGFLRWGIIEKVKVEGNSMYPTLVTGQEIDIEKFISKLVGYKRGQIITFQQGEKTLIKRVIGLPNEIVEIKNKKVNIINPLYPAGVTLEEEYLKNETDSTFIPTCKVVNCSVEYDKVFLGPNELYVLGDNRIDSRDSRDFGSVNKAQIKGSLYELDLNKHIYFKLPKYNISNY